MRFLATIIGIMSISSAAYAGTGTYSIECESEDKRDGVTLVDAADGRVQLTTREGDEAITVDMGGRDGVKVFNIFATANLDSFSLAATDPERKMFVHMSSLPGTASVKKIKRNKGRILRAEVTFKANLVWANDSLGRWNDVDVFNCVYKSN